MRAFVFLSLLLVQSSLAAPTKLPTTSSEAFELARQVKKDATKDELLLLKTLMEKRASWHPRAIPLLDEVINRGQQKRRLGSHAAAKCDSFTNKTTCDGKIGLNWDSACATCMWSEDFGGKCAEASCDIYDTEDKCCANAGKVPTSCFWSKDAQSASGMSAGFAKCKPLTCQYAARDLCKDAGTSHCAAEKAVCATFGDGCQYTDCMGCGDAAQECSCSESGGSCMSPGAGMALMQMLTCPVMDCTMCLKSGDMEQTIDQMAAKHSGECSARCSAVAHCNEEAKCLLEGTDAGKSKACPASMPTPPASCTTKIAAPAGDTSATAGLNTCLMMCQAFEGNCTKSCGAKATCATASTSGTVSGSTGFGLMFAFALAFQVLLMRH